ncbi:hypothetical protein [Neopusillimonas aromaticivorans]|uniref:hypothetical protein n=1 Tax=Neopusillimonas aromaticivorans TaxID=2979868 RepID=UPI002595459A|nr:hypothetical protein [Neopusillimonas aromaticivorans]WJJ93800.1 hypothetical protein N7E01_00550 [Neopusillimonas aromaticivorans]
MQLALSFDQNSIVLKMTGPQDGFLKSLLRKTQTKDLETSLNDNPRLAFAVADLRALADEMPGSMLIDDNSIKLSHLLASRLSENAAQTLGLPPLVHLTLKTEAAGSLGAGNFSLRYEWYKNGQRQLPQRIGCILKTADGSRRIPSWMLEAIDVADSHKSGQGDDVDWEALARFRRALEPDASVDAGSQDARVAMTEFLQGLQVRLVDRFSISPNEALDDFDVVPFSAESLDSKGVAADDVSESVSELDGTDLAVFQQRVRQRGALAAYRVAGGNYVVVDRSAAPVLGVMAEMQRAPLKARSAFIRNPRERISQAIEEHLRSSGKLDNLIQTEQAELIESTAHPFFLKLESFQSVSPGLSYSVNLTLI